MSATTRKATPGAATRRRPLYRTLDWLLVRAPLLEIESYLALGDATAGDDVGKSSRAKVTRHNALPTDPRIRAALAVGSPSLFAALSRADRSSKHDPDSAAKLLRYLIRMSTRPTPYGLFAGVALAEWGPLTDLALAPTRPRTRTRPDMAWLLRFVLEVESRPEVRRYLNYVANPRAFVRAGRVFLPEAAPAQDGAGAGPVSARASSVVRRALALARTPVSHERLVTDLASTPGATREKSEQLIDGLWRQTLLLTDLRPPLTKVDPAAHVARRLRDIPAAAEPLEKLASAVAAMAEWDALSMDKAAAAYRTLVTDANDEESAAADGSQVDMALPLCGRHLTRAVAREAERAAELLLRLTPLPVGLPYLDAYRRAFESRYGIGREVPILELLDPNFGLGPPSPHFHGGASGDPRRMAVRQQTLYDLAISALRDRKLIVELDEKILARLESWEPSSRTAPESLDLSLFVLAASPSDVDEGRFQVVVGPNLGATAAGRNLGRFTDLLENKALDALEELGRAELAQHPNHLWAELVYLPRRFRSANVTIRPHPRPFEIALGTTAGRNPDQIIPLDELVVGVRDGRFYVRWPARDADVLGCAGHMLNNMQAPDVCRFIDDLRRDGRAQFSSFDWGSAGGLPVLPRVQTGRVVLCPAQWRLGEQMRAELQPESREAFMERMQEWRQRWQVPRHVYLTFGDNRLLLDLCDDAQVEELRAELRRLRDGSHLLLQEALPAPEHAWVGGPGGRYITELVVPLVLRADESAVAAQPQSPPALVPADRLRPPGSDWLFVKLYCPRIVEDDLLTGPVAELCQQALTTGAADDWFFIRYADPDPHLRIRFHGQPERLLAQLVPDVCAWASTLLSQGFGTRLCFDTYDREIERFGGATGTAVAEAIFGTDSRAVVEMLRLSRSGVLTMDAVSLAVLSIDDLLAEFGSRTTSVTWHREKASQSQRTMAGDEYRRRKTTLRQLLGDPEHMRTQPGGDALYQILAARRRQLENLSLQLDTLLANGELSQPKSALLRTFVHLHCNRLLTGTLSEDHILELVGRTRNGLDQAPLTLPKDDAEAGV